MKKLFSILFALLIVFCLFFSSVITIFAEAVYIVNGYSYNIVNNSSIAICGWDNSSTDFAVPDHIAGRYVVGVADYGMEYNEVITSVDFSQTSQFASIGIEAFIGCSSISSEVTIPQSVTKIGERAFQECSSLPSVVINADVTTIPKQCFYQCSALENVVLPDTLTTIGGFAFAECTALSYIVIPESVTSIAASSFKDDPNLTLGVFYDSCAHQYAKDNNIPYVLLDEFMLGDANGDGYVNINDVTAIQRDLAKLEEFNDLQLLAADANQDGTLDISDATTLQMFLAKYEISYPIGEAMTQ